MRIHLFFLSKLVDFLILVGVLFIIMRLALLRSSPDVSTTPVVALDNASVESKPHVPAIFSNSNIDSLVCYGVIANQKKQQALIGPTLLKARFLASGVNLAKQYCRLVKVEPQRVVLNCQQKNKELMCED